MIDWDSLKDILTVNGVAYPLVREAWNGIKYWRARKDTLEESVRKDLWAEISNLRASVTGAQKSVIDLQAKYVELLSKHESTLVQLAEAQKDFVEIGVLLNSALKSLHKIEEVERQVAKPDLALAKEAIEDIKKDTANLQLKATALYQS